MPALENRTETESWEDDYQTSPTPRSDVLKRCDPYSRLGETEKINPHIDYKPSLPYRYLDVIRKSFAGKREPLAGCDLAVMWREMQSKLDLCEQKTRNSEVLNNSDIPVQLVLDFNMRAERWRRDTSFQSSLAAKFMHDDYQTIMAMGKQVVPLILGRLQKAPEAWFWALKHLAEEDVAKDTDNPADAAKSWLRWGRRKGYIK
jgi:hypothetical protein